MFKKFKPYAQLIRLPNVFTAAADSLAGWLWVGGVWGRSNIWLPLVVASMAIYAAGIALNDLFDLNIDREERPNRPLPSGRISVRFAGVLSAALLIGGFASACATGNKNVVIVAALLIASVLAYDLGVKRSVLGPEVMGLCRGLNVFLGMVAGSSDVGVLKSGAIVAGAIGLFVVGLTWVSRSETFSGKRAGTAAGASIQAIALLLLAISSRGVIAGEVVLAIVAFVVGRAAWNAWREPIPSQIQRLVKTSVLSLVWLDVAIVAARRGPLDALAVAALWVPAFLLGRWIYST